MVIALSLLADEGLVRSPTELKGERCCFLGGGGGVGLKSGLLKPVGCVGPAGCDWRLDPRLWQHKLVIKLALVLTQPLKR